MAQKIFKKLCLCYPTFDSPLSPTEGDPVGWTRGAAIKWLWRKYLPFLSAHWKLLPTRPCILTKPSRSPLYGRWEAQLLIIMLLGVGVVRRELWAQPGWAPDEAQIAQQGLNSVITPISAACWTTWWAQRGCFRLNVCFSPKFKR